MTARLRLASAGGWDASICAWEGAKHTGQGDAVKVAVQLQKVLGANHPVRGQKFNS